MKRPRIGDTTLLVVAWLVSIVATLGSLYFSEVRGFQPCELCWYQRVFMYPMVLLLGIAAFKQELQVAKYTFAMSVVGGSISMYHILLQNVPALKPFEPCTVGVPCSAKYINWFGFISIPVLALTAFVLVATMSAILIKRSKYPQTVQDDE